MGILLVAPTRDSVSPRARNKFLRAMLMIELVTFAAYTASPKIHSGHNYHEKTTTQGDRLFMVAATRIELVTLGL